MWTFLSMASQCIFTWPLTPSWPACTSQSQARNPYLLTPAGVPSVCRWHLPTAQALECKDVLTTESPHTLRVRLEEWQRSSCVSRGVWMCGSRGFQGLAAVSGSSLTDIAGSCDHWGKFPTIPDLGAGMKPCLIPWPPVQKVRDSSGLPWPQSSQCFHHFCKQQFPPLSPFLCGISWVGSIFLTDLADSLPSAQKSPSTAPSVTDEVQRD